VRDPRPFGLTATLDKAAVVQGDKATLAVKLNRVSPDVKAARRLAGVRPQSDGQPAEPTDSGRDHRPERDGRQPALTVNANVEPGVYTLLVRRRDAGRSTRTQGRPEAGDQRRSALTPVTLTVLPKVVATVTTAVPAPTVKLARRPRSS
jgi:hypothetical protein